MLDSIPLLAKPCREGCCNFSDGFGFNLGFNSVASEEETFADSPGGFGGAPPICAPRPFDCCAAAGDDATADCPRNHHHPAAANASSGDSAPSASACVFDATTAASVKDRDSARCCCYHRRHASGTEGNHFRQGRSPAGAMEARTSPTGPLCGGNNTFHQRRRALSSSTSEDSDVVEPASFLFSSSPFSSSLSSSQAAMGVADPSGPPSSSSDTPGARGSLSPRRSAAATASPSRARRETSGAPGGAVLGPTVGAFVHDSSLVAVAASPSAFSPSSSDAFLPQDTAVPTPSLCRHGCRLQWTLARTGSADVQMAMRAAEGGDAGGGAAAAGAARALSSSSSSPSRSFSTSYTSSSSSTTLPRVGPRRREKWYNLSPVNVSPSTQHEHSHIRPARPSTSHHHLHHRHHQQQDHPQENHLASAENLGSAATWRALQRSQSTSVGDSGRLQRFAHAVSHPPYAALTTAISQPPAATTTAVVTAGNTTEVDEAPQHFEGPQNGDEVPLNEAAAPSTGSPIALSPNLPRAPLAATRSVTAPPGFAEAAAEPHTPGSGTPPRYQGAAAWGRRLTAAALAEPNRPYSPLANPIRGTRRQASATVFDWATATRQGLNQCHVEVGPRGREAVAAAAGGEPRQSVFEWAAAARIRMHQEHQTPRIHRFPPSATLS